jgi:LysR family nitrogen assimilation transcriptional regulator
MNFRRLKYFVKIVDVGSLTQAADLLYIAQPALSQQIVTLENEVHQKLLVRTKRGVTPTEAGKVLYRHAQLILRQCDQAQQDMTAVSKGVSGQVSIGLAPGTAATTLAMPLLRRVRALHPGILLYLNENYGTALSELIMNGRMDLAVLYGNRAIHGLTFMPLLNEELFLVGGPAAAASVKLAELGEIELVLPRPYNIVRKLVDEHFARAGLVPRIVAEVESPITLKAIIEDGLGCTILPASMARVHGLPPHHRPGDRGAADPLPVGPSAFVRARRGSEGDPDGARERFGDGVSRSPYRPWAMRDRARQAP